MSDDKWYLLRNMCFIVGITLILIAAFDLSKKDTETDSKFLFFQTDSGFTATYMRVKDIKSDGNEIVIEFEDGVAGVFPKKRFKVVEVKYAEEK